MESFNILEQKENPLFKRKEIKAEIKSNVSPSRNDVKKIISEKLSTKTENIRIKKILGKFGSNNFIITSNVYESKGDKDNIERKSKRDTEPAPVSKEKLAVEKPAEEKHEAVPQESSEEVKEGEKS